MRTNSIKYLSIYEDLKEEIINGTYPIGGLFPAEPELQTLFGVSRITVRHAVQLLVDEGYLQRIHGVGTVVVSQKESLQLQNLLSFSEEYKGAGVHSDIISFEERISASSLVCSKLNLSKGSEVSCHERLRWSDNSPIGFQRVYCPLHLALTRNELIRPNVSLYQLFKEKGYSVKNANETIESVIADKKIADYLHVKATNGESFEDQYRRVADFLDELRQKPYEQVAIFAHGGILLNAQIYAGIIKPEEAFGALTPYGGIVKIELS